MWIIRDMFFLLLFLVLVVAWLIAWAAFHVTAGAIHLLLMVALVSLVLHIVTGRRAA